MRSHFPRSSLPPALPFLLLAASGPALRAQVEEAWEARYGSHTSGENRASSIAIDQEGNVLVAGYASGGFATIKYGPEEHQVWSARLEGLASSEAEVSMGVDAGGGVTISGVQAFQLVTARHGRQGELLWSRRSPGDHCLGVAQAVDEAGNVFIAENLAFSCHFGLIDGGFTVTKIDPEGGELWSQQFDTGMGVVDAAAALAVEPGGAVHVAGKAVPCTPGALGGSICLGGDLVLVTYDGDGALLWIARRELPAGTSGGARAIAVGPDGTVHVACAAGNAFLTVKYTPDGREVWASIHEPERPFWGPSAVLVDEAGSVTVAGTVEDEAGGIDYAVLRYDAEGRELWRAFQDGPVHGESIGWMPRIALDGEGSVYLAGRSGTRFATIKLGPGGSLAWAAIRPGHGHHREAASAVALDSAGNVHVAGALDGDFAAIKYRQTPLREFVRGDCDGDGDAGSLTDAVFLLAHQFSGAGTPPCRAACDLDGDGDLTGVTDAVYLIAWAFLGGPAPVPPFPTCGPPGPGDAVQGCGASPAACPGAP